MKSLAKRTEAPLKCWLRSSPLSLSCIVLKTKQNRKKIETKKAFLSNLAKQAIAFMEALLIFSYFFCFRTCSYSLREGGRITISWIPTRSTEASNSYC